MKKLLVFIITLAMAFVFTGTSFAGLAEKIVWISESSGNREVWMMNPDGSDKVQLTADSMNKTTPRISHNGLKIAFAKQTDQWEIWVMDVDGRNQKQLTYNGGYGPIWSPDDSKIYYNGPNVETDPNNVSVINSDGTNQQDIGYLGYDLSLNSDGTKIAYTTPAPTPNPNNYDIRVANVDRTNPVNLSSVAGLTGYERAGGSHDWGANGKILFTAQEPYWINTTDYRIWWIAEDGSACGVILNEANQYNANAGWSPDETKIVFVSQRLSSDFNVWIMDSNGTNLQQLTTDPANDFLPHWGMVVETEPTNQIPTADPGSNQTIHIGSMVTLDGSASSDPDENYPLTYAWQIISKPEGSAAALSDSTVVNPTFTADLPGDYTVQLTVTDSLGAASSPSTVTVSTFNTAPVAAAGDDQAIVEIGSTIQLFGTQSYDDDGDPITYMWSIKTKPEGSGATLSDPTSSMPTFVADIHGDYVIELVVSDPWTSSNPDEVVVSFENVNPVAVAGGNQSLIVGETAYLDGSGSYDANLDFLTYSWNVVSKPDGSEAALADTTSIQTSIVTDVPGSYVINLVVNDGFINSEPSSVTIMVISKQNATTQILQDTIEVINSIDLNFLKNKNMANTLTNKINAALELIDQGLYEDALNKLENDILGKTDGCAEIGEPEKNDWIEDCVTQDQVYPLIIQAIQLLESLI